MHKKEQITEDTKKQTLIQHLDELRKRLIYSVIVLAGFALVTYNFSELIVKDMVNKAPDMTFVFIAPAELFMVYIKIALIGAIVLSLPFILYNVWMFLSPGLEKNEKKIILLSLLSGGLLFVLGAIFGYMVTLPITIKFFGDFSLDEVQSMISFSNYLSFAITMVFSFGLIFELPILMVLLVQFGIVKTSFLKTNRKMMVLVIFVVAAVLTPPDIISQTLLALPMLLLFEVGIFFANITEKRKFEK
jgi:sec-independent protein translocase protein TatC